MATAARTFYVTVVQVTILSEQPYDPHKDLDEIYQDITTGDANGDTTTILSNDQVNVPTAARMLTDSGSDPEFFGLDDAGNDIREHSNDEEEGS